MNSLAAHPGTVNAIDCIIMLAPSTRVNDGSLDDGITRLKPYRCLARDSVRGENKWKNYFSSSSRVFRWVIRCLIR